jgi:hypothetical protein
VRVAGVDGEHHDGIVARMLFACIGNLDDATTKDFDSTAPNSRVVDHVHGVSARETDDGDAPDTALHAGDVGVGDAQLPARVELVVGDSVPDVEHVDGV